MTSGALEFRLPGGGALRVEPHGRGLWLTVVWGGQPDVCRKTTRKEVEPFLAGHLSSVFRGRLRLHARGTKVDVEVRGAVIASLPRAGFAARVSRLFPT